MDEGDKYAEYMPHIRARWAAEQRGWEQRRQRAWNAAREIAVLLRAGFGAERVVAFGSLVCEGPSDDRSDIDLAVAGIPGAQFLRAYAEAMSHSRELALELVDLDASPPWLRRALAEHGVEL